MITIPLHVAPDPEDASARQVHLDIRVGPGAEDTQRMLLDTGAARSRVLATSAVAGLERLTPRTSSHGASGVAIEGERVVLPEVAFGPHVLATGLEVDLAPAGGMTTGLLGADVLQGHRAHFRFGDGVLELDGERPTGGFLLELERPGNQPYVEVRAEGLHTRACWDTGAGVTLVDLAFAQQHPRVFELSASSAHGTDAAGASVDAMQGRMGPVRIAGAAFGAADVVAVDFSALNATIPWPMTILLGLPLIAQADWFFDFPGNAWSLTRAPEVAL